MYEHLLVAGALITVLIGIITLVKFLFYTKAEVDKKLETLKEISNKKDEEILDKFQQTYDAVKDELNNTKQQIFEKLLEAERNGNTSRQELYNRLAENKQTFEQYNQHMLELVGQVKQDEKEINIEFMSVINAVKDELKEDYINRYNDLLKLVGTKTNNSDFDRLENKFDKLSQTMTELKTIVELQLQETNKHK